MAARRGGPRPAEPDAPQALPAADSAAPGGSARVSTGPTAPWEDSVGAGIGTGSLSVQAASELHHGRSQGPVMPWEASSGANTFTHSSCLP